MSVAEYNAQKAENNRTIQHAVSSSMDGVNPDGVTDIVVTVSAAAGARASGLRGGDAGRGGVGALAVGDSCFVRYTLRVHDPTLSFEVLRAQLEGASNDGTLDGQIRHYAAIFGANILTNATTTALEMVDVPDESNGSKSLSTGAIVGICLGAVMFAAMAVVFIMWWNKPQYSHSWWHEELHAPETRA